MRDWLIWAAQAVTAHDNALQGVGLACSAFGVWWSVYLWREACQDHRAAPDVLSETIMQAHVRSARVVLIVQLGFALVNVLVLGLPSVPAHDMHPWVLVVIASRKLIRNGLIVFLMWAVWRQAETRQLVLRLLEERRDAGA